jgi:hypothetical protein
MIIEETFVFSSDIERDEAFRTFVDIHDPNIDGSKTSCRFINTVNKDKYFVTVFNMEPPHKRVYFNLEKSCQK